MRERESERERVFKEMTSHSDECNERERENKRESKRKREETKNWVVEREI